MPPSPNKEKNNKIKITQLDSDTARRICSSQVITSMSVAVKELVENALDARATSISIRFVNFGKDLIEVIDNGVGIEVENFAFLGKRNCTSKLTTYDELHRVSTFGFRGEAVNSLCNIAQLSIYTRHATDTVGRVLKFDTNGEIVTRDMMAREVGTTVSLAQLFYPLPVRRKELLANYRRVFDTTLALIYQYCIGMIGIRISCWHMAQQGGRFVNLFTSTGLSLQSNLIEIFNYKQFSNLMPFVCHKSDLPPPSSSQHLATAAGPSDADADDQLISDCCAISGFISKPDTGCGRSTADRQYFYLNGRPCELVSVAKSINHLYRMYNRTQFPFILLQLSIDEKLIDRNLTPDKRKILLADDHYLLRLIQHSLERMYCRENTQLHSMSSSSSQLLSSFVCSSSQKKRNHTDDDNEKDVGDGNDNEKSIESNKIFKRCPSPCDLLFDDEDVRHVPQTIPTVNVNGGGGDDHGHGDYEPTTIDNIQSTTNCRLNDSGDDGSTMVSNQLIVDHNDDDAANSIVGKYSLQTESLSSSSSSSSVINSNKKTLHPYFASLGKQFNFGTLPSHQNKSEEKNPQENANVNEAKSNDSNSSLMCNNTIEHYQQQQVINNDSNQQFDDEDEEDLVDVLDEEEIQESDQQCDTSTRTCIEVDIELDEIARQYEACVYGDGGGSDGGFSLNQIDKNLIFNAKIIPDDNDEAEKELRYTLTKDSFNNMLVVGQFNLGFIIAKLGTNLFIIDQHAIDERYNFETFLQNPQVSSQNLVCPLNLRLSSINEMIVADNLDVFKNFGFGLIVNRDAPVGHRTLLTRIPVGKEWTGGREDVEEIIAGIRESQNNSGSRHFMLSGLRREIAYRACRSAVMIGEALTRTQMEKILAKIHQLSDPWHCAHNRPTIRHLLSLTPFHDWL